MRSNARPQQQHARRLTAIAAIVSVIAGAFVAGFTAQVAAANTFVPTVTVTNVAPAGKDFVLAGENVEFAVDVANRNGGKQFNLSLMAIAPASVTLAEVEGLPAAKVYQAGDVLPNRTRTAQTGNADCTALGLVAAPVGSTEPYLCAVPAGQQVWVWSNVSDLPQGGAIRPSITITPDEATYPVGSEVAFSIRAFTSDDPAKLPTFDGSTSVVRTGDHTAVSLIAEDEVPVKALRIMKDEPSAESERLRGAHGARTVYTVTVENTTRAATLGATITDYLPAGLEYLGSGSTADNSAPGTEYPTAPRIAGGATGGETVETVSLTATQAQDLGLPGAGVYTKVTWTLGDLAAGEKRSLQYRAVVPLFANAMWPQGTAPAPATGAQAANLDNNMGASTRHGATDSPATAQTMRNVASVVGTYQGPVLANDDSLRASSDRDDEVIEAVDVRVLKSVDSNANFTTGSVAVYSVQVDVSEYVDASGILLTDVIPNGLCPAFPIEQAGTALTVDGTPVTPSEWNSEILGEACNYPTATDGAVLSGLSLVSMDYHSSEGSFTIVFGMDDIAATGTRTAQYSAMQRPNYTGPGGGTSSGDNFRNTVSVTAHTEPIAEIAADPALLEKVGGTRYVSDDSAASIGSGDTTLTKTVLDRGSAFTPSGASWVSDATRAFSPGDTVWYRLQVQFAPGIDSRNAELTDYLPEGVEQREVLYAYSGIPGVDSVTAPVAYGSAGFPTEFIPNPATTEDSLTWEFGSKNRGLSEHRFMPAGSVVTVYVRGEVQAQSATREEVDSPKNQAKYQQINVTGDVRFLRADAGIDLDWGSTLTKGIVAIDGVANNTPFGARVDTAEVVQRDAVDYRIDVKAPQNATTDYVVWDVLPAGVKKADVANYRTDLYDGGVTAPGAQYTSTDDVTATAYDAGELPAGIALAPEYAGRSVIVWTVGASVPGSTPATVGENATAEIVRGLSLGYTLTVPAGKTDGGAPAQLTQSYVNTAGIVSYGIENSASKTTTVVPQTDAGGQQLTNRTPQTGEVAASDIDTVDAAEVHLPDVSVAKKLVSTEVGPTTGTPFGQTDLGSSTRNSASQIVQGEHATFEYSMTIPARTSIRNAVLSDNDTLSTGGAGVTYQYVAGSAKFFDPAGAEIEPADEADGFRTAETAGAAHGVLTFPSTYTNDTAQPQTFRVQITMWVKDRDANTANASVPQIANGTQLTNTATLTFGDPNSTNANARLTRTANAQVQFIEPAPKLTKTASSATVGADGTVTYTLRAENGANRVSFYNSVVLDCVPAEITPSNLSATSGDPRIVGDCAIGTGNVIQPGSGTGTLIEWTIPVVNGTGPTGAPTLTYTGTVQTQAGGGSVFTNRAELKGYTLPIAVGDDTDTSDRRGQVAAVSAATVRMPEASILKTVDRGSAPVGEVVTYTLTTTLPASTNFYDAVLTDSLPVGVEYLASGTRTEATNWAGAPGAPLIGAPTLNGRTLTWSIGPDDITAWSATRTITVTFQARITDTVATTFVRNSGTFAWTAVNGSTLPGDRKTPTSTADVTLLNPKVTVQKSVKRTSAEDATYAASKNGNPGQSFTYRVTATNSGTSAAYGTIVDDVVPAGVRVDTRQSALSGPAFSFSNRADIEAGRGGTIRWTIEESLGNTGVNSRDLVYIGTFVASDSLRGGDYKNTARVVEYTSAPTNGWKYVPGTGRVPGGTANITASSSAATITPMFPSIQLEKRASSGSQAFVGESFGWTLQARNTGTGAAQTVTLTDTLPMNWEYDDSIAPQVTVDGKIVTGRDDLVITEENDRQVLTWTISGPAGAALLPGTAGGSTDGQRTVVVTFSTKPSADAVTTAGSGLSVNHVNTLTGSATDTSGVTRNANGVYVGANAQANAQIARADLKIVKEAIGGDANGAWTAGDTARTAANGRAAYTQPQWRITVTNQGPDAANGPFLVTDVADLPSGVTTGAFTARYYSSAADRAGTELPIVPPVTPGSAMTVGSNTTTLTSDGTDRIVLIADVSIQAPATGTAANTADVTGRTFESADDIVKDNEATAEKVISSAADLSIVKTVNTTEPNAGRPISWSIAVSNSGPSVSVSTDAAKITVTDTIPAGVSGVAKPAALTSWSVEASDGWPAAAGDAVTWTYTGTQMLVGPAQVLSLSGIVDSSWKTDDGEIVNSATVSPGATTDPTASNNTDDVPVAPADDTTLAITKTRVVLDGGVWKDASQLGTALPEIVAGEDIAYRIAVTNNGPADARGVRVVDDAPSMLTYVSVQSESGTWTRTAGPDANDTFVLDGTIPVTADADTRSFVVTYAVDASLEPGSVVENWATASATNATNEPTDGDTTDSDRVADLAIVKQALDAEGVAVAEGETSEVTAGTQTRFLLTVTNNGPSISSAPITISDRLPAGLTYSSSTIAIAGAAASAAAPTVSDDGRSISWPALTDERTLDVGATIVIVVAADVAADVRPQTLVNTADVTGPDDFDGSNNHGEADIDIVTLAEMTVQKDVVGGPWIAGTEVEYTITVDNDGPSVADAYLSDVLPVGLAPVSIAGEGWTCDEDAQSCLRRAHPLGESTITVVALIESNVPTGTELTNTANLSWTDSRSTSPHSDSDDAVIGVATDADLGLVKTAIDADGTEITTAVAGESVHYRIDVRNAGPSDAIGPITVTDALPSGIRFTGLTGDAVEAWSAAPDDADPQTVTFTLLPTETGLVNGATAPSIEFEAAVDASVVHGTALTNTAIVSSGTPDSNPENDGDSADVTVVREVDLSITKSHDAASVRIGDELAFALGVRNAGPSEATDVVVTDVVPAGLEVVTLVGDAVGDDWSIESVEPVDAEDAAAGTRVVARYALPLAPGETASALTVNTRVLVAAYSEVVNVADVSAAEITEEHPDRTPDDNRASDVVSVPPMAALVVSKTAVGAFQVGKAGAYEIVVRNDGPTSDPGPITVTDVLPAGLSFASSPDTDVRVDDRVVTWTLQEGLALDEEITLSLQVNVGEAAYPSVTNVVTVDSPSEQTEDAVLTDDATVEVKAADPLATTGGEMAWGVLAVALLMMVSGGLFVAARRRSSAGASVHAE